MQYSWFYHILSLQTMPGSYLIFQAFLFLDLTARYVKVGPMKTFNTGTVAIFILYTLVFLCGTIGNALVIKYNISSSTTKRNGSKFVVVLAIVDLISSIWVPFVEVNRILFYRPYIRDSHWPYGKIPCYVLNGYFYGMFYSSAWLLVAVGIERIR